MRGGVADELTYFSAAKHAKLQPYRKRVDLDRWFPRSKQFSAIFRSPCGGFGQSYCYHASSSLDIQEVQEEKRWKFPTYSIEQRACEIRQESRRPESCFSIGGIFLAGEKEHLAMGDPTIGLDDCWFVPMVRRVMGLLWYQLSWFECEPTAHLCQAFKHLQCTVTMKPKGTGWRSLHTCQCQSGISMTCSTGG